METAKFQEYIINWKNCDISQLVNHFHFLPQIAGDSQFQRIRSVELNEEGLAAIKNELQIKEFIIHMGLSTDRSDPKQMSFSPLLQVVASNDQFGAGRFVPTKEETNLGIVPSEYLEAVSKNWMLTNQSEIDDLFLAQTASGSTRVPMLQRLLRYHFTDSINSLVFLVLSNKEVQKKLKSLKFHLGADHNKLNNKSAFTFSPVLELTTEPLSNKTMLYIARLGLGSLSNSINEDDESILFEYMLPCPSTCG